MNSGLKVLILAAEVAPFVKVGGLADFTQELPQALHNLGVDVRVMTPRYKSSRMTGYRFKRVGNTIPVPVGPIHQVPCGLDRTVLALHNAFQYRHTVVLEDR